MKNKFLVAPLVVAGLSASAISHAQESPWYVGASVGWATTDDDMVKNFTSNLGNEATDISTKFDDRDTAWSGLVGYRFNEMLSLEFGYADYGATVTDIGVKLPADAGGDQPRNVRAIANRDVRGFGLDAVLSLPFADRWSVYGRLGAFRAKVDAEVKASGLTGVAGADAQGNVAFTNESKETVAKFGVGLGWQISNATQVRLEWNRLPNVGKGFDPKDKKDEDTARSYTGEADLDIWSLGFTYRF